MSPWLSIGFLHSQSDARLVELSSRGHERAFEVLVHRYRKPLLAHCDRMRMPAERAEDAVQQGLLQAWLALQRGADVRDVRPWLYRIVRNAALRMMEQPSNTDAQLSEALAGADSPESELDRRLAVRETLASVAALPPLQREALIGTAVDGHSHEHVAALMGVSDGAVRGLVYRARAALRNAATALTPFPLVEWAAHAGGDANPLSQRLAELGAGGGAAGMGALVKGGAAVTAGLLVAGAVVAHPRLSAHEHRPHAAVVAHPLSVQPVARAEEVSSVVGDGESDNRAAGSAAASQPSGGAAGSGGRAGNVTVTGGSSVSAVGAGSGGASGSAGGGVSAPGSSSAGAGGGAPASGSAGDGESAPASSAAGSGASAPTSSAAGSGASAPTSSSAAGGASGSTTTSVGGSTPSPASGDESAPSPGTVTTTTTVAGGDGAPPTPGGSGSGD
jgi:RNA polymerase sigma factor (sigma-70 family)